MGRREEGVELGKRLEKELVRAEEAELEGVKVRYVGGCGGNRGMTVEKWWGERSRWRCSSGQLWRSMLMTK